MNPLAHLNALRALEASVRLGSFTAAAQELGVTPAAVGQQVRKLENALAQPLLMRRANGFEASELARLASEKLASGFAELREAAAIMTDHAGQHRISVTVVPTIAERWLAPRLSGFVGAHPQVELKIDSTHHVHYRASDEYDFALRYDPPGLSGYDEIELFRELLIPVCTPEMAAPLNIGDRKSALANIPLIQVDRSTSDPEWIDWEAWCGRFGFRTRRPIQGLHFTFTTLALRAAYEGQGMFLAQLSITLQDIISGRMAAPFGPEMTVMTGYPYRLISLNPGRHTHSHLAFIDWIKGEAAKTRAAMNEYLTGNLM